MTRQFLKFYKECVRGIGYGLKINQDDYFALLD